MLENVKNLGHSILLVKNEIHNSYRRPRKLRNSSKGRGLELNLGLLGSSPPATLIAIASEPVISQNNMKNL